MPPLPPPLRCGLSGFGSVNYDANPYQSLGVGFVILATIAFLMN